MNKDSIRKGITNFFEGIYNFLTDETTKRVFNYAITLSFAALGLIFFVGVMRSFYLKEDPALIQATTLLMIAFFGAYGYLLNIFFEKDERKIAVESQLYTIILFAIGVAFQSWLDPPEPITEESIIFWVIYLTQFFFIILFISATYGSVIFLLRQIETSTEENSKI